jgi:hypothetical protein
MSDSFRALVDKAVEVLQRHAPPDGLSDHDALTELYGIFDGPEYRSACEARSAIACIYGEPCAHPEKCKLYGECYRKLSANPSHVAPLGRIVEALRPVVSDIFDNFGTYSRGMALSMLVEAVRGIAPRANVAPLKCPICESRGTHKADGPADTPRTNAQEYTARSGDWAHVWCVDADFARELERELAHRSSIATSHPVGEAAPVCRLTGCQYTQGYTSKPSATRRITEADARAESAPPVVVDPEVLARMRDIVNPDALRFEWLVTHWDDFSGYVSKDPGKWLRDAIDAAMNATESTAKP